MINSILRWLFRILKLKIGSYPAKLFNKTKANFIEAIKKHNNS